MLGVEGRLKRHPGPCHCPSSIHPQCPSHRESQWSPPQQQPEHSEAWGTARRALAVQHGMVERFTIPIGEFTAVRWGT